jgi:hypothetical protein
MGQVFIKIVRGEEACGVVLQSRPACDWAVTRDRSSARREVTGDHRARLVPRH